MKIDALLSIACCAAVTGCFEPQVWLGSARGERELAVVVPPDYRRELDLLFVVDNSSRMGNKQVELIRAVDPLLWHLQFALGGTPDLHVGVVTTDMGAGGLVPGCGDGDGDGGRLHTGGLALPEPFLVDLADAGGGRITNYDPALTLAAAAGAALDVGTTGCAYEQPLAAMRAALDGRHAAQSSFLRDGAVLSVVLVTAEDDCSAADPAFYDPDRNDGRDHPKYRCFRDAALCDSADDVVGTKHDCRANDAPEHLVALDEYSDFLDALPQPDRLVVAALAGGSDTVEILPTDAGGRTLDRYACDGADEQYPAVRLGGLADAFASRDGYADHGAAVSRCGAAGSSALRPVAREIRKALGTPCLFRRLLDLDPDEPGPQADCRVTVEREGGAPEPIPSCPDPYRPELSPAWPCYSIKPASGVCDDFPYKLALDVWWGPGDGGAGAAHPADAHVVGRCLVEPEADDVPIGAPGGTRPG